LRAALAFLRLRWQKNWPEISAVLRGGFPAFVFAERPAELGSAVPVFTYHTVEGAEFEADLRFLRENGYHTIQADGLLDHLSGRTPAPERSVVLSFDDGAVNLYRVVYPLLKAYAQRAVAFVAPRFHDASVADNGSTERPCSWSEIREMHASEFVDFQSHTLEHRFLPRWPEPVPLTGAGPDHLRCLGPAVPMVRDFRLAREMLEAELNKPVRHLAFPRAAGTPEALSAGQQCGYCGFWWGALPGRPYNRPGDDGSCIVRISGEFVRRLPGRGRVPLREILRARYAGAMRRWSREGGEAQASAASSVGLSASRSESGAW
jgi:peptidoglycan/xylan/chitin deacetylase (PgdA/CDA1 family)